MGMQHIGLSFSAIFYIYTDKINPPFHCFKGTPNKSCDKIELILPKLRP